MNKKYLHVNIPIYIFHFLFHYSMWIFFISHIAQNMQFFLPGEWHRTSESLWNCCARERNGQGGHHGRAWALQWRHNGPLTRYAKLRVAHAPGTFPRHRLQRKLLVSDTSMHHGTCVTHVPWCMSGSLARGGGENVRGIPGACTTRHFAYLVRGHGRDGVSNHQPYHCLLNLLFRRRSKHQSSASLAFVRGIHRSPVNSPHKWPVTRKMFPFDDVIMGSGVFSKSLTNFLWERKLKA